MKKQVERRSFKPLEGELAKEFKTIVGMTHIYCRAHHKEYNGTRKELCSDCQEFTRFAEFRLAKCPYDQIKPTCKHCPVHCYKKDMKELARTIMVYSGPRMLLKHPYLAVRHLLHDRRPVPPLPKKAAKKRREKPTTESVNPNEQ